MIRLQHIKAVPLAGGNRIGIQWLNPSPEAYSGVKVVCKELTHPTTHLDGRPVMLENHQSEIISNKYLFSLDVSFSHYLDNAMVSPGMAGAFSTHHFAISPGAVVSVMTPGLKWKITDGEDIYLVVTMGGQLKIYGLASVEDTDLQAETVFYYTLFPCNEGADDYVYHFKNRASAMAAGYYDFAGLMYRLLPIIYHRYDNLLTSGNEDKTGPLRRFLELPGEQLDQFYSFACASADLHNLDRVDGRLLPLLAQWIGWETDYNKEIEKQRLELRNANALYRAIGSIPTLETMIKQVTDWENRVKEFMHGIFFVNRPELLYHRICHRTQAGWSEEEDMLSVDYAYDGRPALVRDENGVLWMFFHSPRKGKWEIRFKTYTSGGGWTPSLHFSDTTSVTIDKYPTAASRAITAVIDGETVTQNKLWVFWTAFDPVSFVPLIRYRVQTDGQWSGDETFDHGGGGDLKPRKNPFAVVDKNKRLWLFWMEDDGGRIRLKYNRHNGNEWESQTSLDFPLDGVFDPRVEKDLFVLETDNGLTVSWTRKKPLKGTGAGPDTGLMRHLSCLEIAFRQKSGLDGLTGGWGPVRVLPKVEGGGIYDDREPAAVLHDNGAVELFWASNRGGNWSAWSMAAGDLSTLDAEDAHMIIDNVYSQRTPVPVFLDESASSQDKRVSLLYRSSRGPTSRSARQSAVAALDFRSAGSTSIDDRCRYRLGKHDSYADFFNYTYDTGQPDPAGQDRVLTANTRYTRDTVGIFLMPTIDDQHLINRNQELIKGILERFIPILTRVVYIIELPAYEETVYDYSPGGEPRIVEVLRDTLKETFPEPQYTGGTDVMIDTLREIFPCDTYSGGTDNMVDTLIQTFPVDTYSGGTDDSTDSLIESVLESYPVEMVDSLETTAVDWVWLETWSNEFPVFQTVDFGAADINTNFRSVHTGVIAQINNTMLVRSKPEIYPGVSEQITDTWQGANETKSWSLGSTDFSYSVDFSGGPLKDTLRSWDRDFT